MIESLIDASIVNDELEMLKLRVRILREFGVRTFRICESPTTHQGSPKPLHVSESIELLQSDFPDCNIKVYKVTIPKELTPRQAENYVRNKFTHLLLDEFPTQSILFCDVDEIPHINQLISYFQKPKSIHSIPMKLRYLFANLQHKGVPVFTYSKIGPAAEIASVTDVRWKIYPNLNGDLGVHLSFCGFTESEYRNKLASYGQPEFNINLLNSPGYLELTKKLEIDPLARYHLPGKGVLKHISVESESLLSLVARFNPAYVTPKTSYRLLPRLLCSADISVYFLKGSFENNGASIIKSNLELSLSEQLLKLMSLQSQIWLLRIRFLFRSKVKTNIYELYEYALRRFKRG